MDEDGFFSLRPGDGRRNTTVEGSGSLEDPYVIHFQQSEFYRPPTGELRVGPIVVSTNPVAAVPIDPPSVTPIPFYESPGQIFFAFPDSSDEFAVVKGSLHLVGASATFQANGTGARWLSVGAARPDGNGAYIIAADSQSALAGQPTELSCCGLATGLFDFSSVTSIVSNPRIDTFFIQVSQNSGVSLTLSNLKLWVTAI